MKYTRKILLIVIIISIIICAGINKSFAAFADYDDATADAEASNALKQQEYEKEQNINKSSNNYLKQLTVEGFDLSPDFDKQIAEYNIGNTNNDYIQINASAEDSKATITGTGKIELQSGDNNIRLDVTAENGMVRTYFININKKVTDKSIQLSQLKLVAVDKESNSQDIEITPNFAPNVYSYKCNVYNDIEKINVEALSESNDALITIKGNDSIKEGKNSIEITVRDNNENELIYRIEVNKEKAIETVATPSNETKNEYWLIILLVIIVLFVMLISKKTEKKHKRKH